MAVPKPPNFITNTIEKLIDPSRWEGISGDLHEIFLDNVEEKGRRVATWKYTFQLLGFLRLRFSKKPKTQFTMHAIWYNYFLAAFRSLKRHKLYFGINLTGLVMAITCTLYALLYLMDEAEFNKDLTNVDQIYRLYKHHYHPPEKVDINTAELSGMMAPTIVEEFPEVINQVRILPWWNEYAVKVNENRFIIEHPYFVDSTFFDLFDYNLLAGNPKTVLTAPLSIVLTKSLADKIFGIQNPLGKTIALSDEAILTVTGIVEDLPRQSSFIFDALISWSTTVTGPEEMQMNWMNNWRTQGIHSYLLFEKGAKPDELVAKFPDMLERHFPDRADRYFLKLQPYVDMYLFSDDIESTRGQNVGSIRFLFILGFSSLLIFFIASINYINISLSRASQSIKEIGVSIF